MDRSLQLRLSSGMIRNLSHLKNVFVDFSPSGDVTVTVVGTNYSVPQLQLPLINLVNNNWTVGPFLVQFNQTALIPIESSLN